MAHGSTVRLPSEDSRTSRGAVWGGALAGMFAGMPMMIAAVAYAAVSGGGVALPPRMIAGTFYGPMALVGNGGVIAIGLLTHFAVAIVFGIGFALLTAKLRSVRSAVIPAILYSIAIWAFMTYVVLAVLNETMLVRVTLTPIWWFFLHWIYGGFLGLFTPGLRRLFVNRPQADVLGPSRRAA